MVNEIFKITSAKIYRIPAFEREDFLHDIMLKNILFCFDNKIWHIYHLQFISDVDITLNFYSSTTNATMYIDNFEDLGKGKGITRSRYEISFAISTAYKSDDIIIHPREFKKGLCDCSIFSHFRAGYSSIDEYMKGVYTDKIILSDIDLVPRKHPYM